MTPPTFDALLITCEHATNHVPARWISAFAADRGVLKTHRAWDPGAVVLARELAAACQAPLFEGEFTRLLVDLNRMANSPGAFSEFTPQDARAELTEFHARWRKAVLDCAIRLAGQGMLLHVSCHSFTPELEGVVRETEFGILYDPSIEIEYRFAQWLGHGLLTRLPGERIRDNYPYEGTSDGITTWLRGQLPPGSYAGIEIELNQAFAAGPARNWLPQRNAIVDYVRTAAGR